MNLFEKAKNIAARYMGPQAENFILRQVRSHLKLEPDGLKATHISELAKWVGVSAGLIMPKDQANLMKQEILKLA